jgi:mRNA interferase MazF
MEKDFDTWNEQKKRLEKVTQSHFFKEREIWWCSVGVNVAYESCGKGRFFQRPVLVLKKLSREMLIGLPFSTKKKVGSWFVETNVLGGKQTALIYQLRILSANRFQHRLTTLDQMDFNLIKQKIEQLLDF